MTVEAVQQVITSLQEDADFRTKFRVDRSTVLADFDLTDQERKALEQLNVDSFLGVAELFAAAAMFSATNVTVTAVE